MENKRFIHKGDIFHTRSRQFIALTDQTGDICAECKCTFSTGSQDYVNKLCYYTSDDVTFIDFGPHPDNRNYAISDIKINNHWSEFIDFLYLLDLTQENEDKLLHLVNNVRHETVEISEGFIINRLAKLITNGKETKEG